MSKYFKRVEEKRKSEKRKSDATKVSHKKVWAAIIIFAIAVPTAFMAYFYFGAFIQPPPPPPEEYETGWARIGFVNPNTQTEVQGVDLLVFFYENNTNWLNTTSGISFYVPAASYFYTQKANYWNYSGGIWASEDLIVNNTYPMVPMCPFDSVSFALIAIDGVYGAYQSSDIPDGHHTILLQGIIQEPYYNNSLWGLSSYIPPQLIPEGSYAKTHEVYLKALWVGWNGSICNYQLSGAPLGTHEIFDLGSCNSTYIYWIEQSILFEIEADFTGIQGAFLYYGFIDNVNQWVIPF